MGKGTGERKMEGQTEEGGEDKGAEQKEQRREKIILKTEKEE